MRADTKIININEKPALLQEKERQTWNRNSLYANIAEIQLK